VKLKVFVTEEDGIWTGDDDVDGLVYLVSRTPSRSSSTASWSSVTVRGLRPSYKTRSSNTLVHRIVSCIIKLI